MPDSVLVVKPSEAPQTLIELAAEAYRTSPDEESFELPFPPGAFTTTPRNPGYPACRHSVRGVSFRLHPLPPLSAEINARAEDVIHMIMRDMFAVRLHNITTDGQVIETQ